MRLKPRLLIDIKKNSRVDLYAKNTGKVNLDSTFEDKKAKNKYIKPLIVVSLIGSLFFINTAAFAPVGSDARALTVEEEKAQLEAQLKEYEKQIQEYEGTIGEYQQKGATLQSEISRLNSKIGSINGQISEINSSLNKLSGQIVTTSSKIMDTQKKIDTNKGILSDVIEKVYREDQKGLLDALLEQPTLSDFFTSVNDLLVIQDNLRETLQNLDELKGELINQKELLALEKSDVEVLRIYQVRQKEDVESTKGEKDYLLAVTNGEEAKYQVLLSETEKSAAEIRARIFRLLGGGQMSFEEAYEFAKYAERHTGVRAAMILAVLDRESALGRNVGQCNYRTAMAPGPPSSWRDDITPFLEITSELGLDPDKALVSCPIIADGAYGGAMGPAQFIPTTWIGYADRVSAITGNRPSSPWNNLDAFVASGLYLKDAGASTNELVAAARYYCGGNWQRSVCTNVYGRAVVDRAASFEKDIQILERNN
ncbi:MAG: hypothetical protein COT88_00775 [Candidatus Colwellbacteria bacterium CG10_big_fil_rev_8_21_14_0_10_41_28]|uniref:Transglycosylase SLT domain-containing protein n=1 Tax=Candidatus Colwellbacteria bacterium CG10_big_fil_rev_8_21_14_0_10_41_28 TaxID=1974539 RepID=A0A2H0VHJ7_9BACT|nr:MAG: hypothetical protein COT88_00775 [Candidatus Colwellbacteria bacterium CG10_big_fil_rev_8_21_14_0_10_41_28]